MQRVKQRRPGAVVLHCPDAIENFLQPLRRQLSPGERVHMTWKPEHMTNPDTQKPYTQRELGKKLKPEHKVRDAITLTSCSICHR